MTETDFLTIKIDIGKVLGEIEKWRSMKYQDPKHEDKIVVFASFNEQKTEFDKKPLYSTTDIGVWKNSE